MFKIKSIKEKFSDMWGIPKDIIMDLNRLIVTGNREIYIENHRGILKYTDTEILIKTHYGVLSVCGKDLKIEHIRTADMLILGYFEKIGYEI